MRLIIREALRSFRRAPILSALAITTIAFALFVLGLFSLVVINLRQALTNVEERVEIVMYLMRGTPIEVVTVAIGDIQSFPEVGAVIYVSQDEALARAREDLTEFQGVFENLEQNPLPASLEIQMNPGYRDSEHVANVAARLEGFRFAEDVRFGRDWIENLDRLRNIAAVVGITVGLGFMSAAAIIIGATIRMTVLSRKREIQIMRLVGATDGFVRRPFLLDGAVKGALGGALAIGLTYTAYLAVSRALFTAAFFTPGQAGLFILFGAVVGLASSAVSVGRHLSHL